MYGLLQEHSLGLCSFFPLLGWPFLGFYLPVDGLQERQIQEVRHPFLASVPPTRTLNPLEKGVGKRGGGKLTHGATLGMWLLLTSRCLLELTAVSELGFGESSA